MSLRSIMLVAAAILLTAGTILAARGWLDSERARFASAQPQAVTTQAESPFVLVAAEDLAPGLFVKEPHVRWQAFPDESLSDSYLVRGPAKDGDLEGAVVRRPISKGEPITIGSVVKPGDRGFLAAVLQPGYRAVAIPLDATSGVGGLVFPGDRVDIILTHVIVFPDDDKSVEQRASETVLTDVRMLALDQMLANKDGEPRLAKTASLEVTPKQAEILAVARELGSLSLSLRSLAKDDEELARIAASGEWPAEGQPQAGRTYTWDSDASRLVPWRRNGPGKSVLVSRGNVLEEVRIGGSK